MEKYLTVEQAAALLAITPKGVRLRVARRQIPFIKMGKLVRIPATQLNNYMRALGGGCGEKEALSNMVEFSPAGKVAS